VGKGNQRGGNGEKEKGSKGTYHFLTYFHIEHSATHNPQGTRQLGPRSNEKRHSDTRPKFKNTQGGGEDTQKRQTKRREVEEAEEERRERKCDQEKRIGKKDTNE